MATKSHKKSPKRSRYTGSRKGFMPGEYARKGIVTVERILTGPGTDAHGERGLTEHIDYVVTTRRFDNEYVGYVTVGAELWRIPHKVLERLWEQRKSIQDEHKVRGSRERHQRLAGLAENDQPGGDEVASERAKDLEESRP